MSDSLRPHGRQHTRLPCALPSPGVCANSCPLSQRCHPIISSSVVFFSCLQSFPALGSFLMSRMSCGMAKKRKKTQRIPSTFFRKKKRERWRKCKSTGSKNKVGSPTPCWKSHFPSWLPGRWVGKQMASTLGLEWVSKPLSPGLFPAVSNYAFPPHNTPHKVHHSEDLKGDLWNC